MKNEKSLVVAPFLRWAGGKRKIIKFLQGYFPLTYNNYWEPFLGSGAVFFKLAPHQAFLSDINADLINSFNQVKENTREVYAILIQHQKENSKEYYYKIRAVDNELLSPVEQAARFIYLNKSSFNGIYRVNEKGQYNVPFGQKLNIAIPSFEQFQQASQLLKSAEISNCQYGEILENKDLAPNDLVYIDPPYPPINGTSFFTHYTKERFSIKDHFEVSKFANSLNEKGCKVIISNSDQVRIREFYKGWNVYSLPIVRWIAANGSRTKVMELIITNYLVDSVS